MIFLDTDHLTILANPRASGHALLFTRLTNSGEPLGIPIITVEEQCTGWLAKIHRTRDVHVHIPAYERLKSLFRFLRDWDIISWNIAAADAFSTLRKQKIRIGSQDLKIAAITLVHDALLLSANLRDYRKVPGLRVENWLENS